MQPWIADSDATSPEPTRERNFRWAVRLEWFTVAWNLVEAAVAIAAGMIASSISLIAFGADSLIEVISGVAVLWRFRQAGHEAQAEEHGLAERRALKAVAATFVLLAVYVGAESILALVRGEEPEHSGVGLLLSIVSLIVMPILAYGKTAVGRALRSRALLADAMETWVCVYLSFALLAGVGFNLAFGWWWADRIAALAMLPVILWQGWDAWSESRYPD